MKLSSIRSMGRRRLPDGREVNIHKGRIVGRGCDCYFYLYRGKRNFVSSADYHASSVV